MVTDSYRNKTPVRGLALLASLGAGSLALTGCAAPAAEIEPVAAERLSLDGCNAQAAQKLVGAAVSEAVGKEAQRLAGAESVRWIGPGDMVTQDFNSARLNIETDGRRITAVRCG
jgi:hypothetical protein